MSENGRHGTGTARDFDDYLTETEASKGNYLWKYHDRHGCPKLTDNPDTVEFRRETFGHDYTIVTWREQ